MGENWVVFRQRPPAGMRSEWRIAFRAASVEWISEFGEDETIVGYRDGKSTTLKASFSEVMEALNEEIGSEGDEG